MSDTVSIDAIKVFDYVTGRPLLDLPNGLVESEKVNVLRGNCIRLRHNHTSSWLISLSQKETLVSYFEIDIKLDDLQELVPQFAQRSRIMMTTSKYRSCQLASIKKVTRFQESGFKGDCRVEDKEED